MTSVSHKRYARSLSIAVLSVKVIPCSFSGCSHSGDISFLKNDHDVTHLPCMWTARVASPTRRGCVWFHIRPKSWKDSTLHMNM